MNATTDWRNLPAGRELDRVIAERAGQPVLIEWNGVLINGDAIPTYSTSTDVALTLMPGPYDPLLDWSLSSQSNGYYNFQITEYNRDGSRKLHIEERADIPALAICRAWLAWMETKGE